MPNFLIIGAMKAGTTSIYKYLQAHPQIFMSHIKEPYFFLSENVPKFCGPGDDAPHLKIVTKIEDYQSLFQKICCYEKAIGEASVYYLSSQQSAALIHHHIPGVKLIVIFRQPADRAFSNYAARVRKGWEWLEFSQALEQEEKRIQQKWHPVWFYRQNGCYATHFKRYLKLFPREQMRVYLFEDFRINPEGMLQDIFAFLEVDQYFKPDLSIHYNIGGIPKSKILNRFIVRNSQFKTLLKYVFPAGMRCQIRTEISKHNTSKLKIDPEIRMRLTQDYREEILQLQDMIHRDLSEWLV
ncbi:MAG: sulfotransferase [Deltaproteobacteria bacterium]